MSPYERIAEKYILHPEECPFSYYEEWHKKHGFLFATPDFYIMGRPVLRSAGDDAIRSLSHVFTKVQSDAWLIHAFAGDMNLAWSILPWPLPWIGWERDGHKGDLRFYRADVLRRLSQHVPSETSLAI